MPRSKRYFIHGEKFVGKTFLIVNDDRPALSDVLSDDRYSGSALVLPSREGDAPNLIHEIERERARDYRRGLRRVGKP